MLSGWVCSLTVMIIFAGTLPAFADVPPNAASDDVSILPQANSADYRNSNYYTVDENSPLAPPPATQLLQNPMRNFAVAVNSAAQTFAVTPVVLTRWLKHPGVPGNPMERYDRLKHFGRWINDPTDNDCVDTRAKVLERDSLIPVTYKSTNRCRVATGLWKDPYAGKTLTDARDIQIDHFVPLKAAYTAGGWKWSPLKKCLYANFMANDFHLESVYGIENMIKGDSSPENYVPSNKQFICEYLERWLKVKLIWNLNMTSGEAQGIRSEFQRNNCDLRTMKMSRKQLFDQRSKIVSGAPVCVKKTHSN